MGKMKKLLVLLIVAVGLLGLSTGAFAQAIDVCNSCKGGTTVGTLFCPTSQSGPCQQSIFNYQTRQGYADANGDPAALEPLTAASSGPYRAIFNVCNCLNSATTFVNGHRIGIRLTILVNGVAGDSLGAYWANPNQTTVNFGMYATPAETCALGAYASVGVNNIPNPGNVAMPRSFGPGQYYKADGVTTATPYTGTACAVPSSNRPVVYTTNLDQGYTITLDDEIKKLSRWWIILPDMRIDSTVLKNGEMISVKIETLDQATGGICALCVATCECTIDVAKACGAAGPALLNKCLFPYFTSTTAADATQPFWNGIAVVNTSSTAGTATLTVFQKDGATGTFTTPEIAAHSMYVAALENVGFTGTGLGGAPLYIKVQSTFSGIDGFAMIANTETGESMGYLCRRLVLELN